jgi:opacity protein-like surface antigen
MLWAALEERKIKGSARASREVSAEKTDTGYRAIGGVEVTIHRNVAANAEKTT